MLTTKFKCNSTGNPACHYAFTAFSQVEVQKKSAGRKKVLGNTKEKGRKCTVRSVPSPRQSKSDTLV
jgi:hypothetical protein